jgi:hypothetical protein
VHVFCEGAKQPGLPRSGVQDWQETDLMPLRQREQVCRSPSSTVGGAESRTKQRKPGATSSPHGPKHRRKARRSASAAALLWLVTLFSSLCRNTLAQQQQQQQQASGVAAAPSASGGPSPTAASERNTLQRPEPQTRSYLQPLCSATINYGASIGDNTKHAAAEVPIFVGSFSVLAQGLEQASRESSVFLYGTLRECVLMVQSIFLGETCPAAQLGCDSMCSLINSNFNYDMTRAAELPQSAFIAVMGSETENFTLIS